MNPENWWIPGSSVLVTEAGWIPLLSGEVCDLANQHGWEVTAPLGENPYLYVAIGWGREQPNDVYMGVHVKDKEDELIVWDRDGKLIIEPLHHPNPHAGPVANLTWALNGSAGWHHKDNALACEIVHDAIVLHATIAYWASLPIEEYQPS